jgi:undecaprenyl-diphosphatase
MLATGSALVYVGAHVSKAAFDRPRPPAALVDTGLSSFPSGHAAYSTAYVVMGVIAARVLPGRFSRAALVAATVVIAALIGASRTYLRAHYASDVAAGWALGATIFAACGIVALVVAYVRNNGGEHRARPARPAPAVDH